MDCERFIAALAAAAHRPPNAGPGWAKQTPTALTPEQVDRWHDEFDVESDDPAEAEDQPWWEQWED
jgi:hypothetical protein